ncbi:hypothetical protein HUT06_33570 [Actinomadura sp. NAK00032]|uniref:hypothetical protein n=1 Tax=Actinomadura sp. NAK00032 TaxID=2742128 RepID=UPI00158FE549|nr:hypothetical protein [Actinomadura sp. NAK00032]QKW38332.1 hypothetical protein HUT06_33570 [Actinomadura sp. NAK00032]
MLLILDARGVAVPDERRARILEQSDRSVIGRWVSYDRHIVDPEILFEKRSFFYDYKWQSDFAKDHRAAGYVQGMSGVLAQVLHSHGAYLDALPERVTGCTDPDQLKRWIQRAAVMREGEDLFE